MPSDLLLTPGKFDELLTDFYDYMDLSGRAGSTTRERWLTKLEKYLESDVILAFEKMEDTEERKPKNIPKAVKAALAIVWAEQGKNPNEWIDYGPCQDCNRSGFFRIQYFHQQQNNFAIVILYCSSCNNYLNLVADSAPRTSVRYLKSLEARFKPGRAAYQPGPCAEGVGTVPKIQAMAHDMDNNPARPKQKELTGGLGRHMTQTEKDTFVARYQQPPEKEAG